MRHTTSAGASIRTSRSIMRPAIRICSLPRSPFELQPTVARKDAEVQQMIAVVSRRSTEGQRRGPDGTMRLMDVRTDLAPTGTLRASINLGNPVLAQGTPTAPSGVTVDIARELGARLGVPVELVCFDAARDSLEAMRAGRADICFLAIDPARAETVAFTPPYVVIEGVFAVPPDSPLTSAADVDRPGVRVGVKQGSAYDLFLSRTLAHAEIVRGEEGTKVFTERQ